MSWLLALTSPQALSQLGASLTARFNAELAAAEDHPGPPAARRFEAMFKIKQQMEREDGSGLTMAFMPEKASPKD